MRLATHNGFVTITNPKTGKHRTFRIRTETWGKGRRAVTHRVVGLLTGTNNTRDYTNFGFIRPDGTIQVWKKHCTRRGETSFVKFAKMLVDSRRHLYEKHYGFKYTTEGRCRKCNRMLTVGKWKTLGLGKKCASDLGISF